MNTAAIRSNWDLQADASPTTSPRVTKLQTKADCYYLKECLSIEAVEQHLDLLEYLACAGLPVPRYITTVVGQRYAVDDSKAYWLSLELPGHHFAQVHGPTGLEQVERLAGCLGELHEVLADAPNPQCYPAFGDSAEHLLKTLLAHVTPFDVYRLQRLRGKGAPVGSLPTQLIHRDFHRGNVLFMGESVSGLLDFDLVHQGPRLFDVCYCASSVLSESFREPGYAEYWLTIVEPIFRGYGRLAGLSRQERLLAWSMLITIELIFMNSCLHRQDLDAALMNQGMLFWFEDHRSEIEAAIAAS
jgi:Ser/Thr protein kinase RdoA (MazF antagonist)